MSKFYLVSMASGLSLEIFSEEEDQNNKRYEDLSIASNNHDGVTQSQSLTEKTDQPSKYNYTKETYQDLEISLSQEAFSLGEGDVVRLSDIVTVTGGTENTTIEIAQEMINSGARIFFNGQELGYGEIFGLDQMANITIEGSADDQTDWFSFNVTNGISDAATYITVESIVPVFEEPVEEPVIEEPLVEEPVVEDQTDLIESLQDQIEAFETQISQMQDMINNLRDVLSDILSARNNELLSDQDTSLYDDVDYSDLLFTSEEEHGLHNLLDPQNDRTHHDAINTNDLNVGRDITSAVFEADSSMKDYVNVVQDVI